MSPVFVAAVTILSSCWSSETGDFYRALALERRGIHIETYRQDGFMKYAVEMSSGAMIYIPSFIKTGSVWG
jgi:hypothetical protein